MNQNDRQQVARITAQAGSDARRPSAFQKAQTRREKKKPNNNKGERHILSGPLALSALSSHHRHTKLRAIHHCHRPRQGCSPASFPLPPQGTSLPLPKTPAHMSRVYLQIRHVSVALLGAGVVRQLHVPEAGELIHEEGVLFDNGVENVLGIKAGDTMTRSGGSRKRCWLSRHHGARGRSKRAGSHRGSLPRLLSLGTTQSRLDRDGGCPSSRVLLASERTIWQAHMGEGGECSCHRAGL